MLYLLFYVEPKDFSSSLRSGCCLLQY